MDNKKKRKSLKKSTKKINIKKTMKKKQNVNKLSKNKSKIHKKNKKLRVSKYNIPVFFVNSNKKSGTSKDDFKKIITNKLLEIDATIILFTSIYKVKKSDSDLISVLKSMRNKNFIIPESFSNKDLELFHLKMKEFIPLIVKKINDDFYNNKESYIIEFDDYDNKFMSIRKKKEGNSVLELNEKTNLDNINLFFDNLSNKKSKKEIQKGKEKELKIRRELEKKQKIKLQNRKINSGGGNAYLQRLMNKGDEPVTGNDMAQTIQEIAEFLQHLRYTPEGRGSTGFQVLYDLFTGNDMALEYYFKFDLLPKYASIFPPKLRLNAIIPQIESIAEYLTLYTTHRRTVKQGKVETGELTEEDLKPDAIDKLADQAMSARYALLKASYLKNPQTLLLM